MKAVTAVLFIALTAVSFAASNEPFASFRFIDTQLSAVNAHATELKTKTDPKARRRTEKEIRAALIRIQHRCHTRKAIYRARGSRYGARMFNTLERDAVAAERALIGVQRGRPGAEAKFEKATLVLVLRYQSWASNYGANHCEPRQRACCEPKRDPETNRESGQGCRWTCVSRARACTGFLGPRTVK